MVLAYVLFYRDYRQHCTSIIDNFQLPIPGTQKDSFRKANPAPLQPNHLDGCRYIELDAG